MVFNMIIIIVILLVYVAVPISSEPELESFRPITTTPNIEPALLSIAERLRALEHVYSLRFAAPRWELTAESQNRKLEALESKISRIETLLELKIDKLTEGLTSKALKEELSKEQLSRKIDTVYERLNHRMSYMESRIENNIVKQLTNLDASLNRISQQIEPLEKSVSEIEGDLLELSNSIEEIKNFVNNFNSSLNNQQNDYFFRNISDENIKKVEKNILNQFNNFALKGIVYLPTGASKNLSFTCQFKPLVSPNGETQMLSKRAAEALDTRVPHWVPVTRLCYTDKQSLTRLFKLVVLSRIKECITQISDMYNEMTRRGKSSEDLLKNSVNVFNITRKDFQDSIQILKSHRKHSCQSIPEDAYDYLIEKIETMTRKNEGNYQRLDNTIERLHEKQELYQESCHRLQLNEPQIENRIGQILEKILDSIDNRTYTTDKNYDTILERLKSHHSHVIRSIGHTTSAVIKLSEQISNDFKALYYDIAVNNPTADKIDVIIGSLKQLQEQFFELNLTLTYTNQLSPSHLHTQEVLNTTATILTLMQNLNENINTIIDKLNHYYRSFPDSFDTDDKTNAIDNFSKKILNIFNMTEEELYKTSSKDSSSHIKAEDDENLNKNGNDDFELGPFTHNEDDLLKEKSLD